MRRAWLVLGILWLLPLTAVRAEEESAEPGVTRYTRTESTDDILALDVAVREMVPKDGEGARVWLIGVVHIADAAYYRAVQELLDAHPAVLYEGVMPPGTGRLRDDSPQIQVEDTRSRLAFLARAAAAVLVRGAELPEDYAGLVTAVSAIEPLLGHVVRRSSLDAWGRPIRYEPGEEGDFRFVSLGADGLEGGEGHAADLEAGPAAAAAETDGVREEPFHLQKQLAELLGLVYQGESIDYEREGWEPSDMAIDQLRRAVAERGGDFERLEEMLAGRGLRGLLVRFLIGLIKAMDLLSGGDTSLAVKAALVTALGSGPVEPEPDGALDEATLAAIIGDRNQVVMEDLDLLLAACPDLASVAVFYGAGHMPDFERRLHERGFRPGAIRWLRAIDVELTAGGRLFESMRRRIEERMREER